MEHWKCFLLGEVTAGLQRAPLSAAQLCFDLSQDQLVAEVVKNEWLGSALDFTESQGVDAV